MTELNVNGFTLDEDLNEFVATGRKKAAQDYKGGNLKGFTAVCSLEFFDKFYNKA